MKTLTRKWIAFCVLGMAAILFAPAAQAATLRQSLAHLQNKWAVVNYRMTSKAQQERAITALAAQAARLARAYPRRAEPLILQANILCTKAGIENDISSLDEIEKARALLLRAEKINPRALDGAAYAYLGWLYHKLPGWPIAFGDDEQAERYLKKAIALAPNGRDSNFYYGNFLYEEGHYAEAKAALERSLRARARPLAALADAERRKEAASLLRQVDKKLL
ncbi:MAG: hypothetical protein KGI97_01030 [Alphaproteobacteria bacterium]|nr:hypothetical protein [Alphaproteobacteria bacterium]